MKLIAVWGSSGAGKTTVALALAAALSRQEDVLVLSTDSRAPALPVYLPENKALQTTSSIGSLLDVPGHITESNFKDRLHQHPKCKRLFFAGYASGELPGITYKPVSREASKTMLQQLKHSPFEYVIVDCDANPLYDATTLNALEYAEFVLRVITPDVKGYEFQKAQMAWMSTSNALQVDRHIKIANPVFSFTPLNDAKLSFGGFHYLLPYAPQVAAFMSAGQLLWGFNSRAAIEFGNQIDGLAEQVQKGEKDIGD